MTLTPAEIENNLNLNSMRISENTVEIQNHDNRITNLENKAGVRTAPTKKEFQEGKSKYSINFFQSIKGNSINYGSELIVRVRGAESVSGTIKNVRGNVLQVDQSHSKDEDKNVETINFTLKHKRFRLFGNRLPKGTYELNIRYHDKENGDGGYKDIFEIV